MAIKPSTLTQPERDLSLADREGGGNGGGASAELRLLQARLERAKQQATIEQEKKRAVPVSRCACFERGWLAAIAAIENGSA